MSAELNWQIQLDKPLFPDIEWERPQQKSQSGKLLIIGGHSQGFNDIGSAYKGAVRAGAGEIKVILPDKLKPLLKNIIPEAIFMPSTPSGSLGEVALNNLVSFTDWADAVLIIQTGTNSESTLLITKLVRQLKSRLVITDDLIDVLNQDLNLALRQNNLLVLSFNGLQKLYKVTKSPNALLHDMGLRPFVLALQNTMDLSDPLVSIYDNSVIVKFSDNLSSTKKSIIKSSFELAGFMSVWWIQQLDKPFEVLTASAYRF